VDYGQGSYLNVRGGSAKAVRNREGEGNCTPVAGGKAGLEFLVEIPKGGAGAAPLEARCSFRRNGHDGALRRQATLGYSTALRRKARGPL